MKIHWKLSVLTVLCSVIVGCAPRVVVMNDKIISHENYELSMLGQDWETHANLDTYDFPGLRFYVDFIAKNKSKNQYIFASRAAWSTDMDKIIRKKRETFTGEDTIIKYFGEDVKEWFGVKPEQIQFVKTGEIFGHNKVELEIVNDITSPDEKSKVRLFVVGKGRRGNPFDAGYDFIVLGYVSSPDKFSDSLHQFDQLIQSFKMYD